MEGWTDQMLPTSNTHHSILLGCFFLTTCCAAIKGPNDHLWPQQALFKNHVEILKLLQEHNLIENMCLKQSSLRNKKMSRKWKVDGGWVQGNVIVTDRNLSSLFVSSSAAQTALILLDGLRQTRTKLKVKCGQRQDGSSSAEVVWESRLESAGSEISANLSQSFEEACCCHCWCTQTFSPITIQNQTPDFKQERRLKAGFQLSAPYRQPFIARGC